jgi:hypothetical protein
LPWRPEERPVARMFCDILQPDGSPYPGDPRYALKRVLAKAAEKDDVCIYSFTKTYGEMMPAAEFIRHIERSIRMIEAKTGEDLSRRDDREIIEPEGDFSSILMTLNF